MIEKINKFNKIWGRLLQLITTITIFLLSIFPYPVSLFNWPKLLIFGSWTVSCLYIRPDQHRSKYIIVISLIIGFITGFIYWYNIDIMAIEVNGKMYIRGELTEQAKDYFEKNPTVTEKEYLIASNLKEEWLWTPESRNMARVVLGGLYSVFIFSFGLSILGTFEIYARSNS